MIQSHLSVDKLLSDIKDIAKRFQKSEVLQQIDKDICLAKIRELYDVIYIMPTSIASPLQKVIEDVSISVKNPEPVAKHAEIDKDLTIQPLQTPILQIDQTPIILPDLQQEAPAAQTQTRDITTEVIPEVTPEIKPLEPINIKQADKPLVEKISEPKSSLYDKISEPKQTLYDKLAETRPLESLASKLQNKPLDDIEKAIGINERFKFIKNLFNGNQELYKQTITALNSQTSFQDALNYIVARFDWKMEDEATQMLISIVKRRYSE